ncbi:MAG: hypothetical protein ACHQKZ_07455 [Solirubrobacterales bacterium]|jgi:hypothetical protein
MKTLGAGSAPLLGAGRLGVGLLLLLALGGCGSDSGTDPGPIATPSPPFTGPVTGAYDLLITPAAACGFPAGPYSVVVQAQQVGPTNRPELRATLAGGSALLVMEMLFTSPGVLRGSISTQQPLDIANGFTLFLRNVGMGTVSAGAGGRGEVRDAPMNGDVQIDRNNTDLGTCTSSSHRWSLRPR